METTVLREIFNRVEPRDMNPFRDATSETIDFDNLQLNLLSLAMGSTEMESCVNLEYILEVIKRSSDTIEKHYYDNFLRAVQPILVGDMNDHIPHKSLVKILEKYQQITKDLISNLDSEFMISFYNNVLNTLEGTVSDNFRFTCLRWFFTNRRTHYIPILLQEYEKGNLYFKNQNSSILSLISKKKFAKDPSDYMQIIDAFLQDDTPEKERANLEKFVDYLNVLVDKNQKHTHHELSREVSLTLSSQKSLIMIFQIVSQLIKKYQHDRVPVFNSETLPRTDLEVKSGDTVNEKIHILHLKCFCYTYNPLYFKFRELKREQMARRASGASATDLALIDALVQEYNEMLSNSAIIRTIDGMFVNYVELNQHISDTYIDSFITYCASIMTRSRLSDSSLKPLMFSSLMKYMNKPFCNKHFRLDILTILAQNVERSDCPAGYQQEYLMTIVNFINTVDLFDLFGFHRNKEAHLFFRNLMNSVLMLSVVYGEKNKQFVQLMYKLNSKVIYFVDQIKTASEQIEKIIEDNPHPYTQSAVKERNYGYMHGTVTTMVVILQCINLFFTLGVIEKDDVQGEVILPVITMASNLLKYFTNGRIVVHSIFGLNTETHEVMKQSLILMNHLRENENFIDTVRDCKDDILEQLKTISVDPDVKANLTDKLTKITKIDPEEIPEKFTDPLLCVPIKRPVMIPNVADLIFDETSILSQIRHEKINPYTREPLDEEILEEYNKRDEIKERISRFMQELSDWRKSAGLD